MQCKSKHFAFVNRTFSNFISFYSCVQELVQNLALLDDSSSLNFTLVGGADDICLSEVLEFLLSRCAARNVDDVR
jgi:hypothetical protein